MRHYLTNYNEYVIINNSRDSDEETPAMSATTTEALKPECILDIETRERAIRLAQYFRRQGIQAEVRGKTVFATGCPVDIDRLWSEFDCFGDN